VCVCSYMMFASKIEISVVKNANEWSKMRDCLNGCLFWKGL
jgi:hypothetical protein